MNIKLILLGLLFSTCITLQSQHSLFIGLFNSEPDRASLLQEEVAALQKDHLDNIGRFYDEGSLFFTGAYYAIDREYYISAVKMVDSQQNLKSRNIKKIN